MKKMGTVSMLCSLGAVLLPLFHSFFASNGADPRRPLLPPFFLFLFLEPNPLRLQAPAMAICLLQQNAKREIALAFPKMNSTTSD